MFLSNSGANIVKSNAVDITIRDISLERLYSVLFTYFELYPGYEFNIVRKSKFYELNFKGWGGPRRGGC